MKTRPIISNALILLLLLTCFSFAQNAGEIVFSTKMLTPANQTELTNTFKSGDNIYALINLSKPLIQLSRSDDPKKLVADVFIYELKPPLYSYQEPSLNQLEVGKIWISGEFMNTKSLPIDIVPDPNNMTSYTENLSYEKFGDKFYGPVRYALALSKLEPGKHEIVVKLNFNYKDIAEGKFIIEGNDFSDYKTISKTINSFADENKTKGAEFPKAAMKDSKLEKEMITAFKNSNHYKDKLNVEVTKISITDPDWNLRRNDLTGVILNRYIRASVLTKEKDGTCVVRSLTFRQDYIGNKFDATKFDGFGDTYKIPCENAK